MRNPNKGADRESKEKQKKKKGRGEWGRGNSRRIKRGKNKIKKT